MDEADHIWNRACDPSPLREPGDRALQAVLLVHGQVMNGGLASALEYRNPDEIDAAVGGFEYFGRGDIGRVLREAVEVAFPEGPVADVEEREDRMQALYESGYEPLEQLDSAYNAFLPQDEVLVDMFRERLRTSPGDFAPLE